jgi:2-amino-4-hydroxy-6-hydroxymethyldihydropteridine diphosphokinase
LNEAEGILADHQVLISLGSNIDPEKNIQAALSLLDMKFKLLRVSNIYETPPYGSEGGNYLNAACEIVTTLTLKTLKYRYLRPIERRLGRERTKDIFAPRTIDLDILVFDDRIIEPDLFRLAHLAVPAAEIAPHLVDPQRNLPLKLIAEKLISEVTLKHRIPTN